MSPPVAKSEDLTATRERVARVEASMDGVRGAIDSMHGTVRDMAESIATYHTQAFEEVRALRHDLVRIHQRIDERHEEAIQQAAMVAEHAREIAALKAREGAREARAAKTKAWLLRSAWAAIAAGATWALGQLHLPASWRWWQ